MEPGRPEECNLETFVNLDQPEVFSNFSFLCYVYEEIDSPTNVVTDRVTEDTVAVSWDPVRAVIDKYVVRYISADGETRDTAVPREENSTVLTGLRPGEAYEVYVWAERGNQESKKADTMALTGNRRRGVVSHSYSLPSLNRLPHGRVKIDS